MISIMLAAVLASAGVRAPTPAIGADTGDVLNAASAASGGISAPDEPAVRITLSGQHVFDPGDRARVRVHVRDDSYLVVLHADPNGTVRVMYPAHPGDDDFVHAGEDFDIRSGDQDASFVVESVRGTGTIYAAVSKDPYHFDAFADGDQWSATAFSDTARGTIAEGVVTDLVQRMATAGGRFDYDVATYSVVGRRHARDDYYAAGESPDYYPPAWGAYGPYYDPWFNPWFNPWYGPGFGFGVGGPWWGYNAGYYGGGFFPGYGFGYGGCFGCFGGGYVVGFAPGYFGGHGPLVGRPGFVSPIGYRPRGILAAGHTTLYPGRIGGMQFANRRGLQGGTSTVFRQVRSAGPGAQPGMGRVMEGEGSPGVARAVRAAPFDPRGAMSPGHMNAGGRVVGTPVGPRTVGPARVDVRNAPQGYGGAAAQGHRVQAGPDYRGGGGYAASPRSGGYQAARGSGGGGGGGGGGGQSSGGGHSSGGGGGHGGGGGGGHGGGGHGGGGHR